MAKLVESRPEETESICFAKPVFVVIKVDISLRWPIGVCQFGARPVKR